MAVDRDETVGRSNYQFEHAIQFNSRHVKIVVVIVRMIGDV